MSGDLIESGKLRAGIPVQLAGTGTGPLHDALELANRTGFERAQALVASWLPDTPHDARRRTEVSPTKGRTGPDLRAALDGDVILRALEHLDADESNMSLVTWNDGRRTHHPLAERGFARPRSNAIGRVNGAALMADLQQEGLLHLLGLDRSVPALADLAEAIDRCTGAAVNISAFLTGSAGACVGMHGDDGEVWVVQLEGSKQWTICDASVPWFDRTRSDFLPEPGEVLMKTRLEPGDSLVVPKGALHEVRAEGELTVALSIVLATPSRASLLEAHLEEVGRDPDWLEPLHWVDPAAWPDAERAPTAADLAGTLARIRAARAPRTSEGAVRWWFRATDEVLRETWFRSTCGGGAHVVEDVPGFNSIVVALGGRMLRLRRRCLDLLPTLFSGAPFRPGDIAWPGSFAEMDDLMVALGAEGVITPLGAADAAPKGFVGTPSALRGG